MFTITYRYEDWTIAGIMTNVKRSKDECVVIAQKYMESFRAIASASVNDDTTETLVRRTTGWQKMNG